MVRRWEKCPSRSGRRAQGPPTDAPGQPAKPAEEGKSERANATLRVVRMADEALGQERRLFRVVGDEARLTQQPEPVDAPEPSPDRPGRHPLGRQAQRIAQRRSQQDGDQAILDALVFLCGLSGYHRGATGRLGHEGPPISLTRPDLAKPHPVDPPWTRHDGARRAAASLRRATDRPH